VTILKAFFFYGPSVFKSLGKSESLSSHWANGHKHTVDMEGLVFVLML